MIEFPEAIVLAKQIRLSLVGKEVVAVTAAHSPHKFAWYRGDPNGYGALLTGVQIEAARPYGGLVEIQAGDVYLVFGEGTSLAYLEPGVARPQKHQLLLEFADGSALVASVQMYGGLWAFRDGDFANPYYHIAREKPSPLAEEFSLHYFQSLARGAGKVSAKAFLATEQRVPGLGNGVLQDILYNARIHPKRKLDTLSEAEYEGLYKSVRATLRQMAEQGGRDTEKDLYGQAGGYTTIMSKKNIANPCPSCGGTIKKEAYLGGSVYYCPSCQGL